MPDFPKKSLADWDKLATADLKGAPLHGLAWHTPEGIAVKPLYTAADLERLEAVDSLPGFPPYLRGPRATMYAQPPLDHPPICRLLHRRGVERLLPRQPGRGSDRPLGRLRSGDPSRL